MANDSPSPRRSASRSVVRGLVIATWVTLVASCGAAVFNAPNVVAEKHGYDAHRDIAFDAAHKLALDVYTPSGFQRASVVVFFYGGGWKEGSRREYRFVGAALAAQGIVIVIPDYRKYPQVKLDGFMSDATIAVGWTRAHIADYGGDPGTIFLMGYSAGAQIGALLATDASWLARVGMKPRNLAGFIGLAGPYYFTPITEPDLVDMFGVTPAQQRRSQPFDFVNGDEPPMLLLQGTDDHIVNPRNAKSLAYALRAYREPVEVHLYPGVDHDGIVHSLSRPSSKHDPELAGILAFIRTHSDVIPAKAEAP